MSGFCLNSQEFLVQVVSLLMWSYWDTLWVVFWGNKVRTYHRTQSFPYFFCSSGICFVPFGAQSRWNGMQDVETLQKIVGWYAKIVAFNVRMICRNLILVILFCLELWVLLVWAFSELLLNFAEATRQWNFEAGVRWRSTFFLASGLWRKNGFNLPRCMSLSVWTWNNKF